jgi:hypothetical protein
VLLWTCWVFNNFFFEKKKIIVVSRVNFFGAGGLNSIFAGTINAYPKYIYRL